MRDDASAFGMTFSESADLECACHAASSSTPLFRQSLLLADWPNNVSRVLATLPHTHTNTRIYACMYVDALLCLCVFSTRCLPHKSELHGEWNFPLFVNMYMKCLFVGVPCRDVRMYVRDVYDVTNGRRCHNTKICNINKKLSLTTVPAWNT